MTIIKHETKLNLGCGPTGINGWNNLDWGWLPMVNKLGVVKILIKFGLLAKNYEVVWPNFELFDIRKRLPYENNNVDAIYCSHVLEHFELEEGRSIAKEAFRVLNKGGIMRVILPDVLKINYSDVDLANETWWGFDKQKINGWQRWFIRGHQWMYSAESAIKMLKSAGFDKVVTVDFKKGQCPDIDKLDLSGYKDISLYLEAYKT